MARSDLVKRVRTIAVVNVQDATMLAEQIAAALGGRARALVLLRQAVAVLERDES